MMAISYSNVPTHVAVSLTIQVSSSQDLSGFETVCSRPQEHTYIPFVDTPGRGGVDTYIPSVDGTEYTLGGQIPES